MATSLLQSVGFEWEAHPHRLHTMHVDPSLRQGIELRGGPWTTGVRAKDSIRSRTAWHEVEGIDAEVVELPSQSVDGPGIAEARWPLNGVSGDSAVAVTGLYMASLSHPAGFQVAGFGVGTDLIDGHRTAWLRVEAGRVPERRERFEQIAIEATITVALLHAVGPAAVAVQGLNGQAHTAAGFRPRHTPTWLAGAAGPVAGLAGWSWSVTNTPKRRGRAFRGFEIAALADGAAVTVTNSGEVTRRTDLDITADIVVGASTDG